IGGFCGRLTATARILPTVIAIVGLSAGMSGQAAADTLEWALAQAYQTNPQLNSQRAIARQADEAVSQGISGFGPTVAATANLGRQFQHTLRKPRCPRSAPPVYSTDAGQFAPHAVGITGTQTLFNGFQTDNKTRQAEQQVSAARETLRLIEQNVLLN